MRYALALEHEPLARLRPRRNGEPRLAVEDGHVHLVTEAHLRIGEGQGTDQIGAVSLEDLVGANLDEDIEIARGSAVESAFALAGEAELIPVRDARGNGHGEHPLARHASLAAAGPAGLRRRPFLLARPATGLAALMAGNLELGLQAPGRLFERDLQSILKILTSP